MELSSEEFDQGAAIPSRFSCEGDDVSPPLAWSGEPEGTASLALICDDPDAPRGVFVHWLTWGIDPGAGELAAGDSGPVEGTNGFGRSGYGAPCPPPGRGPHRYFFRLYALDATLDVPAGAPREELEAAMQGHVIGTAELMGTYERR